MNPTAAKSRFAVTLHRQFPKMFSGATCHHGCGPATCSASRCTICRKGLPSGAPFCWWTRAILAFVDQAVASKPQRIVLSASITFCPSSTDSWAKGLRRRRCVASMVKGKCARSWYCFFVNFDINSKLLERRQNPCVKKRHNDHRV